MRGTALLIAIAAAAGVTAQNAVAQGVSSGPCFVSATDCILNTIAATPNPVVVGTTLELTTDPAKFEFTAGTVVMVTPINFAFYGGLVPPMITLCGPAGTNGAFQVCAPDPGGARLRIPIPAGPPIGDTLIQKGTEPPTGFWVLFAYNPAVAGFPKFVTPAKEAPLPTTIQFVPTAGSSSSATLPPPVVQNLGITGAPTGLPDCAPAPITLGTGTSTPPIVYGAVSGLEFQPGARVLVSYIYFVDPNNNVFRTDYNGKDSHTEAITSQTPGNSTTLGFSINVEAIHQAGGDPYSLGGNYYVQVQNPDGQISGGPITFTFQPWPYYGHCQ